MSTKKCLLLTGERIQLYEYRSRECSVPPEDISKHCGFDYHKRHASIDSTKGGDRRREANREIYVDSYFYTRRRLIC